MGPLSIAKASLPYLVNAGGAVGLVVLVVGLQKLTSKGKLSSLKNLALAVATAVGVFFAGKKSGYSTLPMAVGLLAGATFAYGYDAGYIEEEEFYLAAIVIPAVVATALERFGFLPRIFL